MTQNISFFIPAYNCSATIEEAVLSIMETNFEEGDELVIVNDFSTDDTGDVISRLQSIYTEIKCVQHSRNKGGAAARNTAIENCSHELLFCLDSDNVLEKNSIKDLKNHLIDESADAATFQHLYYFSEGTDKIDKVWTLPAGVFTKQDCLSRTFSPGASGNYLFTKNSWLKAGGYPEFAGSLDTWGFGFRQLMVDTKMVVLADTYYFHRLLPNSYYLRDAWSRRKSVSLRGLQLLIPFLDQVDERDVDYIFSNKGRYTWKENLEKHPIRIVNTRKKESVWEDHQLTPSFWGTCKERAMSRLRRLYKKTR